MSEHEDWMRYWCLDLSQKIHRYDTNPEKIIKTAERLHSFVSGKGPASVVAIGSAKKEK